MRVSELDITVSGGDTEANRQLQAERYRQLFAALKPWAGQLIAVQLWGITDDQSWRASGYPLLFDADARPKDAFYAIIDPEALTP